MTFTGERQLKGNSVFPKLNVPILPMITNGFKNFGYYVFSMPVTSLEN